MSVVFGLDGGGTKTLAALADRQGRVLRCDAGPGLDPTAGPDWQQGLADLVGDYGAIAAGVLGLPYHGEVPWITAEQQRVAAQVLHGPVQVVNDVQVAFEGAFAGGPGVLVLAGTGSMAWARGVAQDVRVGGWGDVFGDEGSAHFIGLSALRRVSWHLDGRTEAAVLCAAVLRHLGLGDGGAGAGFALIDWAYGPGRTRATVAGLARIVDALAEAGCDTARDLMAEAAGHLVLLARVAAGKAGLSARSTGPVQWSHGGGVFRSALIRAEVGRVLGTDAAAPRLPPLGGALLAAARMAGWQIDAAWVARLSDGLHAVQDRGA